MKKITMVIVFIAFVESYSTARAEAIPVDSTMPIDMASILGLIESFGLTGGVPSTLNISGCAVVLGYGFPYVDLKFTQTATCGLNGTIRIGFLPLYTSVNLQIANNPFLKEIHGDFTLGIRRDRSTGTTTVNWQILNGSVTFQLQATMPTQTYAFKGAGLRVRTSSDLTAHSQTDFFDKPTGIGFSLVRDVHGSVKETQSCTIVGADASSLSSGTLSNCHPIGQRL